MPIFPNAAKNREINTLSTISVFVKRLRANIQLSENPSALNPSPNSRQIKIPTEQEFFVSFCQLYNGKQELEQAWVKLEETTKQILASIFDESEQFLSLFQQGKTVNKAVTALTELRQRFTDSNNFWNELDNFLKLAKAATTESAPSPPTEASAQRALPKPPLNDFVSLFMKVRVKGDPNFDGSTKFLAILQQANQQADEALKNFFGDCETILEKMEGGQPKLISVRAKFPKVLQSFGFQRNTHKWPMNRVRKAGTYSPTRSPSRSPESDSMEIDPLASPRPTNGADSPPPVPERSPVLQLMREEQQRGRASSASSLVNTSKSPQLARTASPPPRPAPSTPPTPKRTTSNPSLNSKKLDEMRKGKKHALKEFHSYYAKARGHLDAIVQWCRAYQTTLETIQRQYSKPLKKQFDRFVDKRYQKLSRDFQLKAIHRIATYCGNIHGINFGQAILTWNVGDLSCNEQMQAIKAMLENNFEELKFNYAMLMHLYPIFDSYGQVILQHKDFARMKTRELDNRVKTTCPVDNFRTIGGFFDGVLSSSFQQFSRFEILMLEIVKKTPEDSPEYQICKDVYDLISNLSKAVNHYDQELAKQNLEEVITSRDTVAYTPDAARGMAAILQQANKFPNSPPNSPSFSLSSPPPGSRQNSHELEKFEEERKELEALKKQLEQDGVVIDEESKEGTKGRVRSRRNTLRRGDGSLSDLAAQLEKTGSPLTERRGPAGQASSGDEVSPDREETPLKSRKESPVSSPHSSWKEQQEKVRPSVTDLFSQQSGHPTKDSMEVEPGTNNTNTMTST